MAARGAGSLIHDSPFGPHITDYRVWAAIDAYIEATQPRAALVLGDAGLVRHLCDTFPGMVVVARKQGKEEDNQHRNVDGAQWVDDRLAWLGGDTRPVLHWLNEPTHTGVADTPEARLADDERVIAETLRVYARATEHGVKVIGPNWGAYWPQNPERFAPIYHAAVARGHMIGMHYYAGFTWTRDYPATQWMLDVTRQIVSIEPRIEIGGTEFGLDSFPELVKIGALPRTGPPWRLVDQIGFGLEHVAAWDDHLSIFPNIRWLLTFTWGGWFGADYDISHALTYQEIMASQTGQWAVQKPVDEEEEADMPIDMTNTEAGIISPTQEYATIRDAANGTPVGELRGAQHTSRTVETVPKGDYDWRFYTFDAPTIAMPNGWIADSEYVAWEKEPVVEPPPVDPDPPTGGEEAAAAALELVSQARALLDAAILLLIGRMTP